MRQRHFSKTLAARSWRACGIRLRSISVIFGKSKMLPSPSGEEGLSEMGIWYIPLSRKPGDVNRCVCGDPRKYAQYDTGSA